MDAGLSSLSAALTPSASSDAWDALKKAARRVESQAYTRLTDYSRIAQTVSTSTAQALNAHSSLLSSSSASLLSASTSASSSSSPPIAEVIASSSAKAAELEAEITELLQKLSATTEEMSRVIAADAAAAASSSSGLGSGGSGLAVGSETNSYTLQRYRAILHDYSNEFRKTRDSLQAARQRAELLLPAASPTGAAASLSSSTSSPNSLRPRSDLLLREKSSLHSSLRMADDIISQAAEARESLLGQSSLFQAMRGRVLGIRQRFPLLHSAMSRIERQRKKDAIVIAAVIATCICFTVVYASNKPID